MVVVQSQRPGRHGSACGLVAPIVVAACLLVGTAIMVTTSPPSAASPPPAGPVNLISSIDSPAALAFDPGGNLFVANGQGGTSVFPQASGEVLGVPVRANDLASVDTGATGADSIAFDNAGDMFISDFRGTVSVIARSSGSLFGVPVQADTLTAVFSGLSGPPEGLAFDTSGDLFIAEQASVVVLPRSSGTIFGISVTADRLSSLLTGINGTGALAFGPTGDLFIGTATNSVVVLPDRSGLVFGVPVTANAQATVATGFGGPNAMAFDGAGDLYVANAENNTISVLAAGTGSVLGMAVIANTVTVITTGLYEPEGLALDKQGDLFIANEGTSTVLVVSTTSKSVFGVLAMADRLTTLNSGLHEPTWMALDPGGDIFFSTAPSAVSVLPKATGTIFGVAVTADKLATVASDFGLQALALDRSGDLFMTGDANLSVLAKASGTIFGVAVTADKLSELPFVGENPDWLAFDGAGNLYNGDTEGYGQSGSGGGTIAVIAKASGALFGVPVIANRVAYVQLGNDRPAALASDSAGDLFIAVANGTSVVVLPEATGTIFGVRVTAGQLATVASGLFGPAALALDPAGDLYIANQNDGSVYELLATPRGSTTPTAPTIAGAPGVGTVDTPYSYRFSVAGDPAPVETVTAGQLPPGISLSSAGILSGAPTSTGSYAFSVTASNGVGFAASESVQMLVRPLADVAVTVTAPGLVADGSRFAEQVTVTDRGPSTATCIVTNALIPGQLTLTSAPGASVDAGTLVWDDPSLSSGARITHTVIFTVAAQAHVTVATGAIVEATADDPDLSNNVGITTIRLG